MVRLVQLRFRNERLETPRRIHYLAKVYARRTSAVEKPALQHN